MIRLFRSTGWVLLMGICLPSLAQVNEFVVYNEANTPAFAGTGNAFRCVGIGDSVYFAGTQYRGLYKFDTTLQVWIKSIHLTNVFINDIKTDRNRGVWIAQSGTSGQVGGGSNTAGGINYFPEWYDATMQFYSVPGTTTGGGLTSRNVRSVYVDTTYPLNGPADTLPRVWAAAATYITSGSTSAGGISLGLNATPNYFSRRYAGLQVVPFVNPFAVGTPSCEAVGGDQDEVWISVRQNFGLSQILRYQPDRGLGNAAFLGAYDSTVVRGGVFPPGFRAVAIHFDQEGRRWLGFLSGGLRVMVRGVWKIVNQSGIFPAGASVNNNAITSDDQGNVYIGTNNGLLVYNGLGDVDDSSAYTRLTTADGLPSNNIYTMAYDRSKGRMVIATDAGIVFWRVKNRINVVQEWDYSFPERKGRPKGVVADGVSRIYLKITRQDTTLPAISSVRIRLHDYQAVDSSVRGRLKNAAVIDRYSEEASSATSEEITVTDNLRSGEFWAWYVSPHDFSGDSLSIYAQRSVRNEKLEIIVTYANNIKDTILYDKIRIARPPVLLVHGLASGPPTWAGFKHNGVLFTESDRFIYSRAITLNGRALFINNARLLMSGDVPDLDTAAGRLNTLQGNLAAVRAMGYAANQVDYVCHSMGGIVIRHAIDRFAYKFYAGADDGARYKNYNRGFTHKIIFCNSPHNSSPIADLVEEFIPQAPEFFTKALRFGFKYFPDQQQPYDFVQPVDPENLESSLFKASDAVKNLQVRDARGGVNLSRTRQAAHLITGNVNLLDPSLTSAMAELDPAVKWANIGLSVAMKLPNIPRQVKNTVLKPMMALNTTLRVFTFFEWYCAQVGFPDFLSRGDLIVPLASEHARIPSPETKPYITMFNNSPGSKFDASHVTILNREDVGQYVFNLLNTKLYSNKFYDFVPANLDPEPPYSLQFRPLRVGQPLGNQSADILVYDTTKVKMDAPLRNSSHWADSLLTFRFRVKDTVSLAYAQLFFQSRDTFITAGTPSSAQEVRLKIDPGYLGAVPVTLVAAYYLPDNTLKYFLDTLHIQVQHNGTLQGFRVQPTLAQVSSDGPYYPPYEVQYNNQWFRHPVADTSVQITFDPVGVVKRTASGAFTGMREGSTTVLFNYRGFTDSMVLVSTLPPDSFCVNRSLSAGSMKLPANWSKGSVPGPCDSVIIRHAMTLDSTLFIRALRIDAGASLTLNQSSRALIVGDTTVATGCADVFGTLQVQQGLLSVHGFIRNRSGSTYSQSGGQVWVSGNGGYEDISVPAAQYLFDAQPGMMGFSFTGGILQLKDPPYAQQANSIRCAFDFGSNSTLILGTPASVLESKNPNGFGGPEFPARIGRLIINAGTRNGNRQFVNKKALQVRGGVEIRTGSGMILEAPVNVTP